MVVKLLDWRRRWIECPAALLLRCAVALLPYPMVVPMLDKELRWLT